MPTKEFMDTNSKSVVVAGRRGRYQHYLRALKLALVEQTLRPGVGVSVARIARIADYPVNRVSDLLPWKVAAQIDQPAYPRLPDSREPRKTVVGRRLRQASRNMTIVSYQLTGL